jgi:hypothetical protein
MNPPSVAADVRRLKLLGQRRSEPPYVGCYMNLPPGSSRRQEACPEPVEGAQTSRQREISCLLTSAATTRDGLAFGASPAMACGVA